MRQDKISCWDYLLSPELVQIPNYKWEEDINVPNDAVICSRKGNASMVCNYQYSTQLTKTNVYKYN